jgi:hypothetical protein
VTRLRATGLGLALVLTACGGGGSATTASTAPGASGSPGAPTIAITSSTIAADDLRLHEIQVVGTHNSFHLPLDPAEHDLLAAMNPEQAAQRTYRHEPLAVQLREQHVRQIELDVFADGSGGLYASPSLRRQAGLEDLVASVPEMAEPGTKVLHEQDVDYRSVCPTLVACLREVEAWSAAHPAHVPIAVFVQFKDGPLIFPVDDQAVPEPWLPEAMLGLEAEILEVFDRDRILTPDDVQGDHPTLEQAVTTDGWPTLGASRGRVLFAMVNGEPYRSRYLEARPDLAGGLFFTNAEPGQPDAAILNVDDPTAEPGRIAALVAQGYLVRTRADSPGEHARTGDTARRDAAFGSGAHWVGTDYPAPGMAEAEHGPGADYVATLPGGGAARCNPVTAPPACRDEALEPATGRAGADGTG